MNALETFDISKFYKSGDTEIRAVDGVSIAVENGEFVALVGPSGSGKTTMLALLAGLLAPSAGSIKVSGQEMATLNERKRTRFRREKIGFVFQGSNLVPYLNSLENIELMLKLNGTFSKTTKKYASELLDRLGLADRAKSLPGQLSGGQRQRISIARALLKNPPLLLLDEATSALDAESERKVQLALEKAMHGRTTLTIAHRLATIVNADKILVLDKGKLVESGSHEQLLAHNGVYAQLAKLQFDHRVT